MQILIKKKYFFFLLMISFATMIISCNLFIQPAYNPENPNKTGFISGNCLEIKISHLPDKKGGSLIQQRESAYFMAKQTFSQIAMKKILDIIYKNNFNRKLIENQFNKKKLIGIKKEIKNLIRRGKIIDEFYDENNQVTLIFRICKFNLRQYLLNIKLKDN